MTSRNLVRMGGIALTTALLAGVAAPAMAGSFYVQEQSTRGQGRANAGVGADKGCLLYTSPSPRDKRQSRMPSSA